MIQFAYTILYVKDIHASLAFYEKAFGFKQKFIAPDDDYGELDTGKTVLSFANLKLAKTNLPDGFIESKNSNQPFAIEIAFATDNVQETFNRAVQQGAVPVAEPVEKPWGQTVSYVRDIDGFLIEICSPIG
jgi:lactoylglutathione lyase